MLIGGSFAPPLIQSKVAEYRKLANDTNREEVKYHMLKLCDMVDAYNSQPCSKLAGTGHPTGIVNIVPLEKDVIGALWNHVPWAAECEMIGEVFEGIPPEEKTLRDAAFHLLWYAKELTLDRTPLTADQLR